MRAAVIDLTTYIVINLIVANAAEDAPPEGTLLIDVSATACDLGWVYDPVAGSFSNPNEAGQ